MTSARNKAISTETSYHKLFRIIFVIFALYLLGDAFYRWDGFRYYASFSDFLPGLALAFILWSLTAAAVTIPLWLILRLSGKVLDRFGSKINTSHLLVWMFSFGFLGTLVWTAKQIFISPYHAVTVHTKLLVAVSILFISLLVSWVSRNKASRWIEIVEERITPLVWIFGIFLVLSVPLVVYQNWLEPSGNSTSHQTIQSSETGRKPPNIVVVIFDAMAAQDMSLYGYNRQTTPFIDQWAESASVFTRAKANCNWTTPSMVSMVSGKRVWTHQVYNIEGQVSDERNQNIASLLRKNGYYNMAFITNDYASPRTLGISDALDIAPAWRMPNSSLFEDIQAFLHDTFADNIRLYNWILKEDFILYRFLFVVSPKMIETIVRPEIVFDNFLEHLDTNTPSPYFAWIHLKPPHRPYLPPEPYLGMFDSSPKYRSVKSQADLQVKLKSEGYMGGDKRSFPDSLKKTMKRIRSRYNEHIRYCDATFEDFIKTMEKNNRLDNTVIILTSDHGESFEHGFYTHGGPYLHETMTHIPLIIKEPDQSAGRVIEDIVEQVDLTAVILEFAGVKVPSWIEGRSFMPLLRGKELPEKLAFSMNAKTNMSRGNEITRGCLAVWKGEYKLMYRLENKEVMLFNLARDPHELNNIYETEPETGRKLLNILSRNLDMANKRIKNGKAARER